MPEIDKILEQSGLNAQETAAYLALLEMGPSPVLALAKKTGIKRPSLYLILDNLIQKGIVALVPQEKKRLYVALSPERIAQNLEERSRALQSVLPQIMSLFKHKSEQPKIHVMESSEGMMNAYREITTFKKDQQILTFFSFDVIGPEFEKMWDLFLDMYKKHHVAGRDLVSGDYAKQTWIAKAKRIPNYQIRQVPEGFTFFSDSIIYGNKVALISHRKRFAVMIESEDIVKSLRTLWELAWQSARPL